MKIVKERTEVEHDDLVNEALKRVSKRFSADAEFVNKCIESMIEMDYIAKTIEYFC